MIQNLKIFDTVKAKFVFVKLLFIIYDMKLWDNADDCSLNTIRYQ